MVWKNSNILEWTWRNYVSKLSREIRFWSNSIKWDQRGKTLQCLAPCWWFIFIRYHWAWKIIQNENKWNLRSRDLCERKWWESYVDHRKFVRVTNIWCKNVWGSTKTRWCRQNESIWSLERTLRWTFDWRRWIEIKRGQRGKALQCLAPCRWF